MLKKILLFALTTTFLSIVPNSGVLADSTGTSFTITVVNHSSMSINNFRVADYDRGDYSPDLLGSTQTIPPGDSATLTFTDYRSECNFRVKVTTFSVSDVPGEKPTYSIIHHNFCDYPTISIVDANS
jgi:hypothetical protein